MGPRIDQVMTSPYELNRELFATGRVRYVPHSIKPNALATRYDFQFDGVSSALRLQEHRLDVGRRYTHVYINDPLHLRNFKAMFHLEAGYQPLFFVHSHFIDNPECPKFPTDASLWLGQCEAAIRADFNFWQCESAMNVFFDSMLKHYLPGVVASVREKSAPWDDGYSTEEINVLPNMDNVRFTLLRRSHRCDGDKVIVFVPNRVGGRGRSSDYTNCGKFLFDIVPELWKQRQDFVVIAGNPSQKFSNDELAALCPAYVKLVPGALNRDEYRYVASSSHIAVGLYDQDAYGGTAARECVDLGCQPLWLDNYEYESMARATGHPFVAKNDFSNVCDVFSRLLDFCKARIADGTWDSALAPLRKHIVARCSYEMTTPAALKRVGLL
jgi:hypothetical protein